MPFTIYRTKYPRKFGIVMRLIFVCSPARHASALEGPTRLSIKIWIGMLGSFILAYLVALLISFDRAEQRFKHIKKHFHCLREESIAFLTSGKLKFTSMTRKMHKTNKEKAHLRIHASPQMA